MTRWLLTLTLAFFLVACSTTKPVSEPAVAIDPVIDPTVVGAVEEAVIEGSIEAEAAAETGRRIGRVAGIFAAVFGGPESETIDETFDRYRRTRDAVTVTSAVIGATAGAVNGAQRGYEFDLQFAELTKIEGVEATRPLPDEIHVHLSSAPSPDLLAQIAAVFAGRTERAIDIAAAGETALDVGEALIDLGVPASSLESQRDDDVDGVVLRIRYAA